MSKGNKMTTSAAGRIQAATAKANGGSVSKTSFAARAQSAAANNAVNATPTDVKTGK